MHQIIEVILVLHSITSILYVIEARPPCHGYRGLYYHIFTVHSTVLCHFPFIFLIYCHNSDSGDCISPYCLYDYSKPFLAFATTNLFFSARLQAEATPFSSKDEIDLVKFFLICYSFIRKGNRHKVVDLGFLV